MSTSDQATGAHSADYYAGRFVGLLAAAVHANGPDDMGELWNAAAADLPVDVTVWHDPDVGLTGIVDTAPVLLGATRVQTWLLDQLSVATGRTRGDLVAELAMWNATRSTADDTD